MPTACEFFSGIGAFAYAASRNSIKVLRAYDQDEAANETYFLNHGIKPCNRNLDSLPDDLIPQSDLWWMSPPCQPYSVRGKQRDLEDPRSKSFLNLLSKVSRFKPQSIVIENVLGFQHSQALAQARICFQRCGYYVEEIFLCSTHFGVPMKRPRLFVIASQSPIIFQAPQTPVVMAVNSFVGNVSTELYLSDEIAVKYADGFNIVDELDEQATLICFTKNYSSCMKASGSLLRSVDGRLRRFSPDEISLLFGFHGPVLFPDSFSMQTRLRLLGNSVDIRAIEAVLRALHC